MAVFDVVLASQSAAALPALVIGALIAALGEWGFRAARQRALARIGERLDLLVLVGVFSRVMALPAALVERAGSAAQISRLRDFAAIRDVLTGAFAIALLDLPSTLLVFLLLLILGGWIALVPFVALAGFAALFFASRGAISRAVRAATYTAQARDALALEALEARRGLVLAGAEERWIARYRDLAARAAMASARSATLSGQVPQLAQTMVSITALLALYLGVAAVLNQAMSLGALIAGMMLVWRVLAPLQAGFTLLSRWEQTRASIRQVDTMMTLEIERKPPGQTRMAAPARGDIVFQRVSLRYLAHAEPVLSGASFSIRHGELVAITGGDGAGKSSLLKLVAGIYRPQAGVVRIAGHDARSYDPAVLRRAMGWVPQSPALLYGTIAQNLRLGHPSASDDELRDAAARAHVLDAILALPEGFETRVGDNATAWLPRSVLQRLALARALVRPAPILLLDEPASGLDDACVAAVNAIIAERRGEVTILMATHRPSHIRMADLVLRVRDGQVEQVTADAPPARAPLTRLPLFSNVSAR
jgi:ATP-binding cassette subfamily C protein/ATP-binding cassette subfamily C protein LapB